ncbi:MAG: hypothetical protein EHM62_07795 [Methylococcus sp.]|nr:MAG: hypothetical protein EHM62_07795 [Methylococcus sp.]
MKDTFQTNQEAHIEYILKLNEFKIIENGKYKSIEKKKDKYLTEKIDAEKEAEFQNHIKGTKANEAIQKTLTFLSVMETSTAQQYKEIIKDDRTRADYLNLIRLLRTPEYIKEKLIKNENNLTNYKNIYTSYYKVFLIGELEKNLNIERFNFSKLKEDKEYTINDDLLKKINVSFRTDRNETTPKTYNEYIKFYIHKLNNLLGHIKIIDTKRKKINKVLTTQYIINTRELNNYLNLYELSDPQRTYIYKCPHFEPLKENNKNELEINFLDDLELYQLPDPAGLDHGL